MSFAFLVMMQPQMGSSGGGAPPSTDHLLLETGDGLLLEDGSYLLLE